MPAASAAVPRPGGGLQVTQWPAMQRWTREYLAAAFGDRPVVVGDQPVSFGAYCRYSDANHDELPLYL